MKKFQNLKTYQEEDLHNQPSMQIQRQLFTPSSSKNFKNRES